MVGGDDRLSRPTRRCVTGAEAIFSFGLGPCNWVHTVLQLQTTSSTEDICGRFEGYELTTQEPMPRRDLGGEAMTEWCTEARRG